MSKKKTNKKTNGKNFVVRAACVVLAVAVVAAGVCCTGFASRGADGKWFGNGDIKTWHWSDKAPDDKTPEEVEIPVFAGGMFVTSTAGDGFDLLSAQIPVAAYAENGLAGYADNAYTITATVKPDNYATNTGVEWELAWANPESEWATGKTVTDYVTATPSGAGYMESKIVSLTCAAAFGEQVLLTAKAQEKPEVTAVATVDYVQRLEEQDVALSFGEINCNLAGVSVMRKTAVPLQLSAYGTEAGGLPEVTLKQSETPYTIAGEYQFEYQIQAGSSTNFRFGSRMNMGNTYYYTLAKPALNSFEDFATGNDVFFSNYDVSEKGLYFGLKYFIENFGLSSVGTNSSSGSGFRISRITDTHNIQPIAQNVSEWFTNKGDGYYVDEGGHLLWLLVHVLSDYSNLHLGTIFKIGSIVNTTNSIDDIELNPPSTTI